MRGWNIVRTKPVGRTYGRAIPAFIHNGAYHFTTIDVYADGAISCWGFLDRALFAAKLRTGWVEICPPITQVQRDSISIFNLGRAISAHVEWTTSIDELHQLVEATIRELNPSMTGLIDMQGSDTESLGGKARRAKMGFGNQKPYRKCADGSEVPGRVLPVFVRQSETYLLDQWFIYSDGLSQLGTHGDLMPLNAAASRFGSGDATVSVPDGAWVAIEGIGRFQVKEGNWYVEPVERIREALNELAMMEGKRGAIQSCFAAHAAFDRDPSDSSRDELRAAYEAVPKHLRRFCGDMDSKDWPIRRILYGESGKPEF